MTNLTPSQLFSTRRRAVPYTAASCGALLLGYRLVVASSVVANKFASAIELVADVCDVRRGNDARRGQLNAFLVREPDLWAEQRHPGSEDHRNDVKLQFVHHSELDRLPEQRAAAGDCDVLSIRCGAGLPDRALDSVGSRM